MAMALSKSRKQDLAVCFLGLTMVFFAMFLK